MASPPAATLANPLTTFTRLAHPDLPSGLSGSPTRSPRGARTAFDFDPLLANLSPASILEALQAADRPPNTYADTSQGPLAKSIANASPSERALGVRAGQAGIKVREWCDEVRGWQWPDTGFALPQGDHISEEAEILEGSKERFFGSLPESTVVQIEKRIEAIKDEMETLDVEELKNQARGAHLIPDSRSGISSYGPELISVGPLRTYRHLDDLTVVVTATIVQALPYIYRLDKLLDLWAVRIFVLRLVPAFLRQLDDAQLALASAWNATGEASMSGLTRNAFAVMKAVLQDRVAELGQRLDNILDALEGHEDRIPDRWIDEMEGAQADYEMWAVQAEKQVETNELRLLKDAPDEAKSSVPKALSVEETLLAENGGKDLVQKAALEPTDVSVDDLLTTGALGLPLGADRSNSATRPSLDDVFADILAGQKQAPATPPSRLSTPSLEAHSPTVARSPDRERGGGIDTHDYAISSNGSTHFMEMPRLTGPNGISSPKRAGAPKLPPLSIQTHAHHARHQSESEMSDLSMPHTSASSAFSDMSSPQVLDAAAVHYYKTPIDERPPLPFTVDDMELTRQGSQRTERGGKGHGRSFSAADALTRSRASSYLSQSTIDQMSPVFRDAQETLDAEDEPADSGVALEHAFRTSIESLSRSEVSFCAT